MVTFQTNVSSKVKKKQIKLKIRYNHFSNQYIVQGEKMQILYIFESNQKK